MNVKLSRFKGIKQGEVVQEYDAEKKTFWPKIEVVTRHWKKLHEAWLDNFCSPSNNIHVMKE
jgi:hypothetical protein